MATKQFKRCEVLDNVIYVDDTIISEKRLLELLKENVQLKKDNKEYIHGLDLLKLESQSWKSDVRELREQNCQLEKENKQLKCIIKQSKQDVRRLHSELMMRRGY